MSKSILNPKSIVIWDYAIDRAPRFSNDACSVYLWSDYFENISANQFSIPKYVDQNRFRLRDKYNSLLYRLGEVQLKDKKIIDWLEIRPNLVLVDDVDYGKQLRQVHFYDRRD